MWSHCSRIWCRGRRQFYWSCTSLQKPSHLFWFGVLVGQDENLHPNGQMKQRWNYQDKSNLISHRNLLKLCHLLIFANISDLRAKHARLMPSTCKVNILYLSPTPHNYFRLSVMWSSVKTCSSWYLMNNWRKRWEYLKSDSIEVRFTIETPGGATEVVLGHKHLCLVSFSLGWAWFGFSVFASNLHPYCQMKQRWYLQDDGNLVSHCFPGKLRIGACVQNILTSRRWRQKTFSLSLAR